MLLNVVSFFLDVKVFNGHLDTSDEIFWMQLGLSDLNYFCIKV
jgi:hypothetical protein